jgi:hypothetical protein
MKILDKLLNLHDEISIFPGEIIRPYAPFVIITKRDLWAKERWTKRVLSCIKFKYTPSSGLSEQIGTARTVESFYGDKDDYGEVLLYLNAWSYSKHWDYIELTSKDQERISAISGLNLRTILDLCPRRKILQLKLYKKAPFICMLLSPIMPVIPVLTIRHYVSIDFGFAVNSIRKSKINNQDVIIDFLYEIMFLQQKTSLTMLSLFERIFFAEQHKKDAALINAEINGIMYADLIITYLKATIEKTIALVGHIFNINDIETKKDHGRRMAALRNGLPESHLQQYYVDFMLTHFSSENIDDINKYRTGLLHKRGIAELQPHNYVNKDPNKSPLKRVIELLHLQHTKNSACIIGALAMLTDKIVESNEPNISLSELEFLTMLPIKLGFDFGLPNELAASE